MKKATKMLHTLLKISSFYLLPLGLLIAAVAVPLNSHDYEELGSFAWGLLVFILFLTPLAQITNLRVIHIIRSWRRAFGVAAFWTFFFHAAGLIYTKRLYNITDYLSPDGYLFWGAAAGIGMLILGLTSNDFSVKLLKKHWKPLQMIAIPVFFLATAHKFMVEGDGLFPAMALFVVYLVLRFIGNMAQQNLHTAKNKGTEST